MSALLKRKFAEINELLLSYESEETTQLLGQVLFDMLTEQGYQ